MVRLNNKIVPYLKRLGSKAATKEKLLYELIARLDETERGKTEKERAKPLTPVGLLGFAAQKDAFTAAKNQVKAGA